MWSTSSASDPSPLMSRSHICYHSLYALHSIMLLLMVIMMIRIKIETKSKLSYIKQATQFQFSKRNFSNIAFWLSCGVKWNEVAERAEQTKTLFVHISQVSSSLFLIFLWESICTRCHVISIFLCKILIGIVYTLDFCQIQHQNVWLDAIGLLILLEIVEVKKEMCLQALQKILSPTLAILYWEMSANLRLWKTILIEVVGGGSNSCRKLFQYLSKVWKW